MKGTSQKTSQDGGKSKTASTYIFDREPVDDHRLCSFFHIGDIEFVGKAI